MPSTPEIIIAGVKVSFKHRDVRLLNDDEYRDLAEFVEDEQRYEQGRLIAMLIESTEMAGIVKYVATIRGEETDDEKA